jgi:peptide deformylase
MTEKLQMRLCGRRAGGASYKSGASLMNELKMRLCGDLVLREKCAPVLCQPPRKGAVASGDWGGLCDTLNQMVEMMDAQSGVGLAAPQVGIPKRFIVMKEVKNRRDSGITHKMLNPRIVSRSDKTCVLEEGCLSVLGPDDLPIYADVVRPESVVAEWTDEAGELQTKELKGFTARIFQHELDHLDGILFTDHLPPVKREMVMRKVRKRK